MIAITADTIENFRGGLKISHGDLPFELWQVFDETIFQACATSRIVPLAKLVSLKDERQEPGFVAGGKPDPQQRAFENMLAAARGLIDRRAPIKVVEQRDGTFHIVDGNATAQVLMLADWKEAPVELVSGDHNE